MERNYDRYYILLFFLLYAIINIQLLYSDKKDAEKEMQHLGNIKRINESLGNATFNNLTWGFPPPFQHQMQEILDEKLIHEAGKRFYNRPFGIIRGDWEKLSKNDKNGTLVAEASDPPPDLSWRQATNSSNIGTLRLSLERPPFNFTSKDDNLQLVYGRLLLASDIAQSELKTLLVEGLHVKSNGSIYLHGYSSASLYDPSNLLKILPENLFSITKAYFETHFSQSLGLYENVTETNENKTCWVQMVTQLEPFDKKYSLEEIIALEDELEKPQGMSTIPAMRLASNSFIYSPNCPEVVLHSKAIGNKAEVILSKEISYAAISALVGLVEALFIITQTEYTTTHSMVSKVSIWSLVLHMVLDGYLLLIHIYSTIFLPQARLPLLSSAFFFLITLGLYEIKYLRLLVRVQFPETSRLRNGRALGIMNILFYFLMLGGLALLFQTITSRGWVQQACLRVFFFSLYSFWIPQIWRNISRGTSKSLSSIYVVGVSVAKLAVPLYFFACPQNLLGISTETNSWVKYLAAYVVAQILMLFTQDWLGPRWLIPAFLLPPTYNYHPISTVAPTNEEEPLDSNQKDCAICMVSLLTPESSDASGSSDPTEPLLPNQPGALYKSAAAISLSRFTNSRGIMVTPCRHYFHTSCLEQWMRIKLECPVCRTSLPPN
ncbi:hypothetical protein DSO57_1020242 [Entomophthora muscae]|uniref:Uncharacterized protein n=1 Tax=Entomophthora muscae TaxID=34485 RepID=A0ACC2TEV8_9FUNG|nr:hypothetical protein DSO57_1020242 [Entomophthora muscae]